MVGKPTGPEVGTLLMDPPSPQVQPVTCLPHACLGLGLPQHHSIFHGLKNLKICFCDTALSNQPSITSSEA